VPAPDSSLAIKRIETLKNPQRIAAKTSSFLRFTTDRAGPRLALMSNYFSLKTNQQSAPQVDLIQAIKSVGGDTIQAGDGLHIRIEKSLEEVEALLVEKNLAKGVLVTELDTRQARKDSEAAPDLKEFVSK
jgi:hypothetical protein